MTPEQKEFLNEVVLPKLVFMATTDTLPMDMNQLMAEHFEREAKKFNKQRKKK
jgi:hypothetical protein